MDNPDPGRSPAFNELEARLELLRELIGLNHSRGSILKELNSLLSLLLKEAQPLFTEAIFTEFFPVYQKLLTYFTVFGNSPAYSRGIIRNARAIYKIPSGAFRDPELAREIKRLTAEFRKLRSILAGGEEGTPSSPSLPVFPVIETSENGTGLTYIDTLEVKIGPSPYGTRFIIHPTYKEEEAAIIEQAGKSFDAAFSLLPKGKKKLPHAFEVQVFFRSRLGIYSGNSFGALLTLLIYFELYKIAYPNQLHNTASGLAFTGANDGEGRISPIGRRNMITKVHALFFSEVTRFIVPMEDEHAARTAVNKLRKKWPGRKLEIVPITAITDVLNRRDMIIISRRPVKERIKEFTRKYRYVSLVLLPVLVLLGFLYVREFDTNPVSIDLDGTQLKILNKYGVVLWSWTVSKYIERDMNVNDLNTRVMISDINDDGGNEVIFSDELLVYKDPQAERVLLCLNSDQEEVWRFSMHDTLSSPKESNIPPEFSLKIFNTVTINNSKRILLWTNSVPTYPSAIISIDPKTGKRYPGSIWNAGFIQQVAFEDIDDDRHGEIIFMAVDNGLKIQKIVACEFTDREYMLDTRADYFLNGKLLIQPIFEISLPNTDYTTRIKKNRDIFFDRQIKLDNGRRLKFFSRYDHPQNTVMYTLVLNTKTLEIDYFIEGVFRDHRDSLVNAGKLSLPYTDTKEYTDILKNGVRYKLDGKWVTYQEYVTAGKVKALPSKKE